MVEIREEATERNDGSGSSGGTSATGDNANMATVSIIDYLKFRSTDSVLFAARVVTVICSLYYVLPIGSHSAQNSAYSKAFAAAAATNALRIHQRVGGIRFTREFLSQVLLEDSCHYLIYSVLFMSTAPVTMALLPIFLYALLHAANFSVQACNATGYGATLYARKVAELTNKHTQSLLGVIACSEVFIVPIFIAMIFTGRVSIFFPFIYYRFLTLRYMSRRNNSTRIVFYQLRVSLEQAVSGPNCPQIFRSSAYGLINLVCRLCPTGA
uniref:Transmembrane protein 33 n=2 Tax=Ascaris TaxID=6251 RepID=F1LC45_ASCSU